LVDYSVNVGCAWGHDRGYMNLIRPTFSESSLHALHSPRWMYATIFNRLQDRTRYWSKIGWKSCAFLYPMPI